jgi:branched-chain amino acid transport system ATP-binding protein
MTLLELEDIHSYYGDSHVLQGVNLRVEPKQVVCLLGRNGAGKTTTLRSIIGFTPPREGRVLLRGENIARLSPEKIARRGVSLVPQAGGVFPTLTVRENLLFAARPQAAGWTIEKIFARLPQLQARQHQRGAQLSGGERQMVAIGRALLTNSDFLMMDEPTEGLSPLLVREIETILLELKELGHSILLVEEKLPLALHLADRIFVMNKGRIVYECTPSELASNEAIKSKYLGV